VKTKIKGLRIFAALALLSSASAASATTTTLTIGDSLTLQYWFPSQLTVVETQTFTYTGAGQIVPFQLEQDSNFAQSQLVLLSNTQIAFQAIGCSFGPCIQNPTPTGWNGPVLFDNTNGNAFSDWVVISDTLGQPGLGISGRVDVMGITSLLVAPGEIGVNWQGVPLQGEVVLGGGSALVVTPLPAAFPLFATGLGALGLLGWRRKRKAAVIAA
jgi:hypothetical protein